MNLRTSIQQNPVASFIVTTLGLSLAAFLLPVPPESAFALIALLIVITPAAAAFALTALMEGRGGVRRFQREISNGAGALKWMVIAFVLGFVPHVGSIILALATGRITTIVIAAPTAVFIVYFPLALLEEIGWRGFALRRLLDSHSPFAAMRITGVPWALLHFALFFFHAVPNTSPIAEMFTVFAWSLPLTWVYIRSGRSVLVAAVLHGALNGFGFVAASIAPAEILWFAFASACFVDTFLVLIDRQMWFAHPAGANSSQVMPAAVSLAAE